MLPDGLCGTWALVSPRRQGRGRESVGLKRIGKGKGSENRSDEWGYVQTLGPHLIATVQGRVKKTAPN